MNWSGVYRGMGKYKDFVSPKDKWSQMRHKPVGEHFNLSGHSVMDLKVAILPQKHFKTRLQRETAELEFICKFSTINLGLNNYLNWFAYYKGNFPSLYIYISIFAGMNLPLPP